MTAAVPRRSLSAGERHAFAAGDEAALAQLRADLRAAFGQGARAIVVETGDPSVVGEDGFAARLLMMGRWLGTPSIQSPQGEHVARVERRPGDAQARGTHSDLELAPHTDLHDILALGAVREAMRGGDSFLVRAVDLHEAVRQRMPHHLPALRQGYFFGTNPVLRSRAPVSADRVPVFAGEGDGVQCCFNPYFLQAAAQARGEALPPAFADAVTDLRALALELATTAQFRLSPGDVVLWHNWSWLHGRTAFEDDPEQRRLLLRLWLRSDLCPPADIRFAERSVAIDDDHERTRRKGMRVE